MLLGGAKDEHFSFQRSCQWGLRKKKKKRNFPPPFPFPLWNSYNYDLPFVIQEEKSTNAMLKSVWKWMFLYKWPFYELFWPFFCNMYVHLSQNWGSDGHFEVLNRSYLSLVQKLLHKTQIFPYLFFCDFIQK